MQAALVKLRFAQTTVSSLQIYRKTTLLEATQISVEHPPLVHKRGVCINSDPVLDGILYVSGSQCSEAQYHGKIFSTDWGAMYAQFWLELHMHSPATGPQTPSSPWSQGKLGICSPEIGPSVPSCKLCKEAHFSLGYILHLHVSHITLFMSKCGLEACYSSDF